MNDSTTGYTTVPNWMLAADDVTAHMVLVYAALGTYTDREGAAWPSIAALSKRAKVSESSARRALRDLEALGLVETLGRGTRTGAQTSNLYRLHTTGIMPQSERHPLSEGQGAPVSVTDEQAPGEQPSADAEVVKRARATRIPEPFVVTAEMWRWAHDEGMTKEFANEQTVIFVDYWRGRSGQIATKHDWPATWRNWLRRAWSDGRGRARLSGPVRETPDERFRRLMAQADEMERGDAGFIAGELNG